MKQGTQNGDAKPLTLDEAYRKYATLVQSFAKKMFDKCTREEFECTVWERINRLIDEGRFEHVSSERSFIYGILRRVALEQSSSMRARCEMISLSVLSDELECPPARSQDPLEIAARRELLRAIAQYADTLDQPLPKIFLHYFLEGQNSAWIAWKLRMNPNTVRVYIHMLRRKIEDRFGGSY